MGEEPPSTPDDLLKLVNGLEAVGTVSKSGNFCYLKLGKAWQEITGKLVAGVASIFKYDKKLKANEARLRRCLQQSGVDAKAIKFQYYKPLSDVGLHVSLSDVESGEVGARVPFRVTGLFLQRANIGVASMHHPEYYHAQWFALGVELGGSTAAKGRAHISIACFGCRVRAPDASGKSSKASKKRGAKKKSRSPGRKKR